MNLTRALTVAGRLAEAEHHLAAANATLDFTHALNRVLFERALCQLLLAKGDPQGALAAAERARAAGYEDETVGAEVLSWRGRAELALGATAAAVASFEAALALDETLAGQSPDVLVDLAAARSALDGPAQSAPLAKRALEATRQREGNARLKARAALLVARSAQALGEDARAAAAEALSFATDDQSGLREEAARLAR